MEVDRGELLRDHVKQARLGQPVDLRLEVELLEDVAHGRGKAVDVRAQVGGDVVLVAHQLLEVERRTVVEALLGDAGQHHIGAELLLLERLGLLKHGRLGGLEHAVEAAQDGEREDHLAVVGLLEVASEKIGDGPDEGGEVGVGHGELLRLRRESG